ncbi:MAG: MFS transporter [Gammaproteobacteria bacterium]|nr:MFS transporter [Gammaproteobacteria bacterium]NNM21233.1 MFS transporter [Gammaproteobacteria bacterium]
MSKQGLAKTATRGINRAEIVDRNFIDFLDQWDEPFNPGDPSLSISGDTEFSGAQLLLLFDSMMKSRLLDITAREMRARNEGYYTIGSSGHEANAIVGMQTRTTDPAFLHYRSGGFMLARSAQLPDCDPINDTLLSLAASREDPSSGGRHKVWGSKPGWVLPQTSTIASHLPKAVGTAIALAQAKRIGTKIPVPADSIVICSFGDASINHSAAQGAFNAAQWTAYQNLPVPILFVCEDNTLGISVRTPDGWIRAAFNSRAGLAYRYADGLDVVSSWAAVQEAIDECRVTRMPVFLHLRVCRLLGHAGTDVETEYRSLQDIETTEARDPLLMTAETVLEAGLMDSTAIRRRYEELRDRVRRTAGRITKRPRLETREEVVRPMAPFTPKQVEAEAGRSDYDRSSAFGGRTLPEEAGARHLAININRALHDLMAKYPEMTLFGEDVAQKGGVYTVTTGLHKTFSGNRVHNTLLDETTILGMAQGAGYMGLLPFPEIQYLAYLHNAADQLRGEACSLQFFSNNQFSNPMVIRIASLGYQKGFGGHFHNDNSFAALRDIPSLIIACPSRGDDAAMMLRTCAALARVNGRVSAFLEPIALYMTKDLYEAKDGKWCFDYPAPDCFIPFGEGRVYFPAAKDLLIITYGNGVPMSLRVADQLRRSSGANTRILDLRWLKPLNRELIAEHAGQVGRVLVVDEGRQTGGIAEEIFTAIDEQVGSGVVKRRVTGADSYIPLAAAANLVLVSEKEIMDAARQLLR